MLWHTVNRVNEEVSLVDEGTMPGVELNLYT